VRRSNSPIPDDYATSYLWGSVWQYDNCSTSCCGLLRSFTRALARPRSAALSSPAFHQWDAVKRSEVNALANGPGHSYLLQHSNRVG